MSTQTVAVADALPRKSPTAAQRKRYEDLMGANERGMTPSALERHKRAWKALEQSLTARGLRLTDLA
jgi:hypothetical protein